MSAQSSLRAAAVAVLGVCLIACSTSSSVKAAIKPEKDRKKAPEFTLTDANGAAVKLSDFRGKVVLLNFWATWCGPCKVEIPWFIEFQQTYKDRDFVVLGVSFDDDGWKSVKPYLEDKKINYRVMIGSEEVAQQYGGVESLPTTFVVDKQGRIAATHIGLISKSEYKNEIENLLDAKQETPNEDSKRASVGGSGSFAFLRAK
jgi:cytochrome c biogenesis protein CcmG/thiol:disulfide interchange protein DsbE